MEYLISCIIPTYNRADLISDAINSVLNQTYTNFEVLVIDDHSTDNTREVVAQYEDKRVKYIINKRAKGAQGARNTGLFAAKGEWVAMLDSDDIWLPEKLEAQLDYLNRINVDKVTGLTTATALYDFEKKKIKKNNIPKKSTYSTKELLYKNYLGAAFSSFICKRNKAIEVGGLDERFPGMQDMDFYITLSKVGQIHVLQKVLVYIRDKNEDRISFNYSKKLKAAKLLNEKNSDIVKSSLIQTSNRYGRILYYSILSGEKYSLKIIYLTTLLLVDIKHFLSILKAGMKNL